MELPETLVHHYRQLLQTYVVMGSGNLAGETQRLVELFVSRGVTAADTLHLHVRVLEEMVRGLGNRSSRHVMQRADVLVLELLVGLADSYRQQTQSTSHTAGVPGAERSDAPVIRERDSSA